MENAEILVENLKCLVKENAYIKETYENNGLFKNIVETLVENEDTVSFNTFVVSLALLSNAYDGLLNIIALYGDKDMFDKTSDLIHKIFLCDTDPEKYCG
jgi:hypothetical protein